MNQLETKLKADPQKYQRFISAYNELLSYLIQTKDPLLIQSIKNKIISLQSSSLGEKIVKLRTELALSQHQLASRAGISQTSLSFIERNIKKPRISTIRKIACALDVDVEILF